MNNISAHYYFFFLTLNLLFVILFFVQIFLPNYSRKVKIFAHSILSFQPIISSPLYHLILFSFSFLNYQFPYSFYYTHPVIKLLKFFNTNLSYLAPDMTYHQIQFNFSNNHSLKTSYQFYLYLI